MLHSPRFPCFLLSLLSVVPIATANAATLYVSQAGDNSNGATWGTAYQTIGGAVSSATDGDEVWVAGGIYQEMVTVSKPIRILGGWLAGTEIRGATSTIDGTTIQDAVVVINAGATLDGFRITNGNFPGVAIFDAASEVVVQHCSIASNYSPTAGAGFLITGAQVTIKDCNISENEASGGGGGIYIREESSVTIENCTIANNGAIRGGGILVVESTLSMRNCSVVGNIASTGVTDPDSPGGGIRLVVANAIIENCVFANNYGISGHQVNVSHPDGVVRFSNCTFYGKYAPYPEDGQILMEFGAQPEFSNCIFWGQGPMFVLREGSSVTVDHSCVLGGYPGEGNISDDPLFRNPANGDFRLQHNSPCIDAGALAGPADDLDGNPRPIDIPGVGREGDNAFDMGAFEFQLPTPPPDPRTDINQDGLRDATDLLLLLQDWHRVSGASAN